MLFRQKNIFEKQHSMEGRESWSAHCNRWNKRSKPIRRKDKILFGVPMILI